MTAQNATTATTVTPTELAKRMAEEFRRQMAEETRKALEAARAEAQEHAHRIWTRATSLMPKLAEFEPAVQFAPEDTLGDDMLSEGYPVIRVEGFRGIAVDVKEPAGIVRFRIADLNDEGREYWPEYERPVYDLGAALAWALKPPTTETKEQRLAPMPMCPLTNAPCYGPQCALWVGTGNDTGTCAFKYLSAAVSNLALRWGFGWEDSLTLTLTQGGNP